MHDLESNLYEKICFWKAFTSIIIAEYKKYMKIDLGKEIRYG